MLLCVLQPNQPPCHFLWPQSLQSKCEKFFHIIPGRKQQQTTEKNKQSQRKSYRLESKIEAFVVTHFHFLNHKSIWESYFHLRGKILRCLFLSCSDHKGSPFENKTIERTLSVEIAGTPGKNPCLIIQNTQVIFYKIKH